MNVAARIAIFSTSLVGVGAGCASSSNRIASATIRPIDEDLIALLPPGADAVFDVDVEQLKDWPNCKRILALLPEAGQARLHQLGFDPLEDVEAVLGAVQKFGLSDSSSIVLVRGALDLDQLKKTLGVQTTEVDYRGARIVESGLGDDSKGNPDAPAIGRVGPRLTVFGSRVDVRRTLDVVQKESEGIRSAVMARALIHAYSRAPTAKSGRPAVVAGVVPSAEFRERLRGEGFSLADADWVTLAFAVGDGFDIGLIVGTGTEGGALDLMRAWNKSVHDFKERPMIRLTGLASYLDPLVIVTSGREVHVAFRMEGARLESLLGRVDTFLREKGAPRR